MHMTHTGEKGYVLYIPNEFAVEIYDSIMEAGLFLNLIFYRNFRQIFKIRTVRKPDVVLPGRWTFNAFKNRRKKI